MEGVWDSGAVRRRGRKPRGRRNGSDGGKQVFQGPEVGVCLPGLSTSVDGVERGRGGVLGDEGMEVMGQTLQSRI